MVTSISTGIAHLQLHLSLPASLLATTVLTILPNLPLNMDSSNVTSPITHILFNAHQIDIYPIVALVTDPICLIFQELHH